MIPARWHQSSTPPIAPTLSPLGYYKSCSKTRSSHTPVLIKKAVSTSIQTISSPITPTSSPSPQIPTPPTRFLYGGMQPSGATAAVLQAVGFAPRMRRQILWHATLRVYFTIHLLGQCTDIQFSIVSACLSLRAANCSLVSGLWWLCWSATPSNC